MVEVVPIRPSIFEAAHNIAIMFAKADTARDKARSIRIDIGFELIDLKRRIDAGEARKAGEPQEFWAWIKLRNDRSLRDMRKCMALARAEDPEAAAEKEREDTRKAVSKHRATKAEAERSYSKTPAQVVSFDPVERALDQIDQILKALNEDERTQVVTKIREKYPC
jgi:hypothetical protein